MTKLTRTLSLTVGQVLGVVGALGMSASAFASAELFCLINESGSSLNCQYKDRRDSAKPFTDEDISSFIERSNQGAYITVKSKRGFERTFEVDPASLPFKKFRDARKNASASDVLKMKLDIFGDLEKKAIQISDGLDTIFLQSEMLKYDPAVAIDKCKSDMRAFQAGNACERQLDQVTAENRALAVQLTSLVKAFQDNGTCLADYKVDVGSDGSVDLAQLQGLARAYKNRCKKK